MNMRLIYEYIKRMTKDDVKNMAMKQNIILSDKEVDNVYYYIKDNYKEFFYGKLKIDDILKDASKLLSDNNYNKFYELYLKYEDNI